MKFSAQAVPLLILLSSLIPHQSEAFAPQIAFVSKTSSRTTSLASTLAPTDNARRTADDDDNDDNDKNKKMKRGGISMNISELGDAIGGKGRAQLAWDCYRIGVDPAKMNQRVIQLGYDDYESIYAMLPAPRRSQRLGSDAVAKLSDLYKDHGGQLEGGVARLSYISRSGDATTKILLKMADGHKVETVIIPFKGRSTLCVSSQVGCRQGCTFCATGRMGKLRNLTSDEILAQMFFAKKLCRLEELPPITNVVFMGMGEPADNVENVLKATEILTTRELFQMSASKVTVSTVGPSPESFKLFAKAPCVPAWSVHAANDALRKKLVPTTKYPMAELRQGLIDALLERPTNFRTAMLEVALMKGVNDSLKEAEEMAEFAQVIVDSVPGSKIFINLIPFNDIGDTKYKRPNDEDVFAFQKYLQNKGHYSLVRTARGDDKTAACGQLSTKKSTKNNVNP